MHGQPLVLASMVELQDGCFGCTGVICDLERMSGSHGIFVFLFFQGIAGLAGIASRSRHEIHHRPREAPFHVRYNIPDSKLNKWLVKITFLHIFCTTSSDSFSQKTMMDFVM